MTLAGKRLFVATKLNIAFTDELVNARKYLKQELSCKVKWVKSENVHITYAFLGDVSKGKCAKIIEKMKVTEFEKFSISVSNIGCFPLKGRPRIIWLGINRGADKLEEVAGKLREAAIRTGFVFKNDFFPHITLGRIRREEVGNKNVSEVCNKAAKLINGSLSFNIADIELFESVLSSQGPVYKSLYKMDLI